MTPDIILPDQYHYLEIGESEEDYAMEWTEIAPVGYEPQKSRLQSIDLLKKRVKIALNQILPSRWFLKMPFV